MSEKDNPPHAIEVRDVAKTYKDTKALDGISFQVAAGAVFALLGENGAGKTTTIKILATLLRPDSGEAIVNGYSVTTDPAAVRASISLTGQFTAVDDILTGKENLVLMAKLRHLKQPGTIADGLIERFGLTGAAAKRVATYSGGMKRRLDLAMSLVGRPAVIFLDEPTTGLDPQARIDMWDVVRELARDGTTVLLTTHYLDEAQQLADHIAILHHGRIIADGTYADLSALLPPAEVEYVTKEPTLEQIFLHLTSNDGSMK